MFKNRILSISLITAILLVAAGHLIQARPAQASAGRVAASETSSCLNCHENRYYQHDTGNYYCLTEAASRCVDCHSGDPHAFDEKTAHTGLIIYPILNGDISRCESCHARDAQAHVDRFAALAGFSANVIVAKQVPPSASVGTTVTDIRPTPLVLDRKIVTGLSIVLTVVAALLVLCILTNRACH